MWICTTRGNGPGSESCGLVSFAQICAWAPFVAPLSSGHGQRRSACRSTPSHSSHPLPVANKKNKFNYRAGSGGHFQKLLVQLIPSGHPHASQSWQTRSLETFRCHLSWHGYSWSFLGNRKITFREHILPHYVLLQKIKSQYMHVQE